MIKFYVLNILTQSNGCPYQMPLTDALTTPKFFYSLHIQLALYVEPLLHSEINVVIIFCRAHELRCTKQVKMAILKLLKYSLQVELKLMPLIWWVMVYNKQSSPHPYHVVPIPIM